MLNYYQLLDISYTATADEIKRAYRKKAINYHPDKNQNNPQSEELFKQINEAYQVLSNPQKKTQYDLILRYRLSNQKQNIAYNPHERRTYKSTRQTTHTTRQKTTAKPNTAFKKSFRNLSEKNFYRVGAIAFVVIFGIIGIAEYFVYQRELKTKQQLEAKTTALRNLIHYAEIKLTQGDLTSIMDSIRNAKKYYPVEYFLDELNNYIADSLYKRGLTHFHSEKYNLAAKDFASLAQYSNIHKQDIYLHWGKSLTMTDQIQEAEKVYTLAISKQAYHPEIQYELALLYQVKNQHEKADEHITIAEEQLRQYYVKRYGTYYHFRANNKHLPDFHFYLYMLYGNIKQKNGQVDEAIQAYKWAAFLQPNKTQPIVNQINLLLTLNRKREACEQYQSLVNKELYTNSLIKKPCY